jgi:hypothetical protein
MSGRNALFQTSLHSYPGRAYIGVVSYSTGPRPLEIGGESTWQSQVHAADQGNGIESRSATVSNLDWKLVRLALADGWHTLVRDTRCY